MSADIWVLLISLSASVGVDKTL